MNAYFVRNVLKVGSLNKKNVRIAKRPLRKTLDFPDY